jgi:anthranilate synthase/aminodeoxychorismate synthase-like glutamine amidotransferase
MLIIDNYDSFTYNIVEYVRILGVEPIVIKNDELSLDEISKLEFKKIIISPGYGNPSNSGVSMEIIKKYHGKKCILGVCLGHQCISESFGANVIKSDMPCHGMTSRVYLTDEGKHSKLFSGIADGFVATRYHSLVVDDKTVNSPLIVTSRTSDGKIMSVEVEGEQTFGVQFHPEAILTECGMKIIENFILM